jgi:phosphoribosylamine--glycine ligase
VEVFHAGTKRERDSLVTSGGRVLGVTAAADSLAEALGLAYRASEKIHFSGIHYRKDIGAPIDRVKAAGD